MTLLIDPQVPDAYRTHPWIAGQVFYTLPHELLTELIAACGEDAFDPEALELERALTAVIQPCSLLVGYNRHGDAFEHDLLPWKDSPIPNPTDEQLDEMGWDKAKFRAARPILEQRMAGNRDVVRGYMGWLLTNPRYLAERDALFARWEQEIAEHGIPKTGVARIGNADHPAIERVTCENMRTYLDQFADFYGRWRLQHLVTKELPYPVCPQTPIICPIGLLPHMQASGVATYQPDIFPIAPADQLRQMLDDMRVRTPGDHVREWVDEISDSNSTHHSIRKYSQILNLHFYWSLLEQRHPTLFAGRTGKVTKAFGEYLGVTPRAVQASRQIITRRLQGSSRWDAVASQ